MNNEIQDNEIQNNFDFKEGLQWFSNKYLNVLSQRVATMIFALFMICILVIAFWRLYLFLPLKQKFSIIKINENPIDDHISVSRLTSNVLGDDIHTTISKYLIKYYTECRENYDQSYRVLKLNSCRLFVKNYSSIVEYKNFSNHLLSKSINDEIVKYGEYFSKYIDINDIALYNSEKVGNNITSDFLVTYRMNFYSKNKLLHSVDRKLKIKVFLSDLYAIHSGLIPFDFNVLQYSRVEI